MKNFRRPVREKEDHRLFQREDPRQRWRRIHALPRQVVTLAFLSDSLPAAVISDQIARSLCEETQATVVVVRFEPLENQARSGAGTQSPPHLNGEFHMPPCLNRTAAGFHSLALGIGREAPSPGGIASLMDQLSRQFRHVLIEVPASERRTPWLVQCLGRSDLSYLFLQSKAGEAQQAAAIMDAASVHGGGALCVKPITCLAAGQSAEVMEQTVQPPEAATHFYIRGCPIAGSPESENRTNLAWSFASDIRRLAREIGGRLVGLALSSGAAKGFAHIGVIQVLEENGIEVDVVAGASMGAYVGSLWAQGNDGPALERLARELEGRWAVWTLVDPVFPPRQGFMRGLAVKRRLMRTLGQASFADLVRPLRVVATNLTTLERVVFSSGEVATAVHASLAVPGICVPVTLDGETYIDGGIVDPLPADVLREMGVARIIAVDVIPTTERIRADLEAGRGQAEFANRPARKWFRKTLPLDRQLNYFARGNLFEILMRSLYGAQIRVAEAASRHADIVLRPNISEDRWLDFRHPGKFIALGRKEAERHLDEIKALVTRKEVNHEMHSAPEALAAVA